MSQLFSLAGMLGRALGRVEVVDVGAMEIAEERPSYDPLLKAGVARVIGFEPVKAECDKLNARARKTHVYLPYFIGDGTERTFHLCNFPMTSSLYPPNTRLLRRFQTLEELTRVVETSRVQTKRLDDIPEITGVDFLKTDVQGAELDVFRGAERRLAETLVIETEVEFAPMYEGQPLFADVDQHLRARGFALHSFLGLAGRAFKPLQSAPQPNGPIRQHLWSNVVYVRDFMRLAELTPGQLVKMAAILHDAYTSVDLAALALQHHDAKTGGKLWEPYVKRLLGKVPEVEPFD